MELEIVLLCLMLGTSPSTIPSTIENATNSIECITDMCYNMYKEKRLESLISTTEYVITNHSGMKSYESYTALTSGNQYILQQYATTDCFGFRNYNGRYCVAVGTNFNMSVGQFFDAVLENGTIIPCIVGDIKDDKHTDSTNTFTANGCCLEFIVNISTLDEMVKKMGDVSYFTEEFDSSVVKFIVYNELNAIDDITIMKGGTE